MHNKHHPWARNRSEEPRPVNSLLNFQGGTCRARPPPRWGGSPEACGRGPAGWRPGPGAGEAGAPVVPRGRSGRTRGEEAAWCRALGGRSEGHRQGQPQGRGEAAGGPLPCMPIMGPNQGRPSWGRGALGRPWEAFVPVREP